MRWRAHTLLRFALPFRDLQLHDAVALAGCFFQSSPVDNLYISATVGDESRFLQHPGRHGHAGASSAQHLRQKFLRQGHRIRSDPVGAHQQPPRQSLIHFMQTITGGNLCDLHGHDL